MSDKKKPGGLLGRFKQTLALTHNDVTQIGKELDDKAKHSQNPLFGMEDDVIDSKESAEVGEQQKSTATNPRGVSAAKVHHAMPRASSDCMTSFPAIFLLNFFAEFFA